MISGGATTGRGGGGGGQDRDIPRPKKSDPNQLDQTDLYSVRIFSLI